MPETAELTQDRQRRELMRLLVAWLVLGVVVVLFARQNLSAPGLYYDEAVFAGMAKDFVTGQSHGQHRPDHETAILGGRPFPRSGAGRYVASVRSNLFLRLDARLGRSGSELRLPVRLFVFRDLLAPESQNLERIPCRSVCRSRIFQQSRLRRLLNGGRFRDNLLLLAKNFGRDPATFRIGRAGMSRLRDRRGPDADSHSANDSAHGFRPAPECARRIRRKTQDAGVDVRRLAFLSAD